MISNATAKIIHILPKRIVSFVSKKVIKAYLKKYANILVEGSENLKGIKTPTIFVCNHLSNSDGLVLDKVLKDINPTFVAGEKLSNNAVTNLGITIVKTTTIKPNTADNEGLKRIIQLVRQGESIVVFPEGTRSRVGSLIEAKKGIVLIAKMTGVPILPIGLYGTEKLLPINPKGDMSSETFQNADVHIRIGKQFELPKRIKEQDKKDYEEFASTVIMKKIAALLPEQYRGVYNDTR
jgi:1-acyl-sn-glycerol-3-phosphate acyltransferase